MRANMRTTEKSNQRGLEMGGHEPYWKLSMHHGGTWRGPTEGEACLCGMLWTKPEGQESSRPWAPTENEGTESGGRGGASMSKPACLREPGPGEVTSLSLRLAQLPTSACAGAAGTHKLGALPATLGGDPGRKPQEQVLWEPCLRPLGPPCSRLQGCLLPAGPVTLCRGSSCRTPMWKRGLECQEAEDPGSSALLMLSGTYWINASFSLGETPLCCLP